METKDIVLLDIREASSVILALSFAIAEDYGPVDDFKKLRDQLKAQLDRQTPF